MTDEKDDNKDDLLPVVAKSKELVPAAEADLPLKRDILTDYIREINKYELLNIDQELALTRALAETGDIEIAKKLVLHNLRLVVKIAMEYRYAYGNVMDLIQEGNLGLMKGVSKYDSTKGAKLSYYASWWIRSYILKFILDNFRLVKIGTTNDQKKLFYNLLKEKNKLLSLGVTPDVKMIANNLGVSEKSVNLMEERLGPRGGEVSFNVPLGGDAGGKSISLEDVISKDLDSSIEDQLADAESISILNQNLKGFVGALKDRDREIFTQRLLSETPKSLQQLANDYGVSRERIRQIEERLLKNLKVYMLDFLS